MTNILAYLSVLSSLHRRDAINNDCVFVFWRIFARKKRHAVIRIEGNRYIYRSYREVNCRRQVGLDVKKFNVWEKEWDGRGEGKGKDRRQRVRKGERGETRTGTKEQRGKTSSLLWASANVSERDREKKVHFPNNAPGSAGKVGLVFSRFLHPCFSPSGWFSLSLYISFFLSFFYLYIVPRHNGFLSLVKAVLSPPPWHEQRLF